VVDGHEVNAAILAAGPGDTILLPPGFYQEVLLVEKPVKILGQCSQDIQGRQRRGVVIQSNRAVCVLCNDR
jgi:nitrous oxidase accessory protein NosD